MQATIDANSITLLATSLADRFRDTIYAGIDGWAGFCYLAMPLHVIRSSGYRVEVRQDDLD
jgi:hypothetical protein